MTCRWVHWFVGVLYLIMQVNIHTDTLNESGFVESAYYVNSSKLLAEHRLVQARSKRLEVARFIRITPKAQVSASNFTISVVQG